MKKFISVMLTALLIFSSAIIAFASSFDCTMNYNSDTLMLELSGTSASSITVMVYESSVTSSDILSGTLPVALWQFDLDSANGKEFEYSLPLGKLSAGEYTAKAKNADGVKMHYFKHFDPEAKNNSLKAINDAALVSSAEVLIALRSAVDPLMLDSSFIDTYGEISADIIHGRKLYFDSPEKLIEAFEEAKAIYEIVNADGESFESALEANDDNLNISTKAYYEVLSDSAKEKLMTLINSDSGYKTEAFNECFAKLSALAAVSTALRWQDIKAALTDTHKNVISINISGLKNPDSVFRKMMNYTYTEFDDIAKNFKLASVSEKESKPSYGGGSSGGGVPVIGDTTGYTDDIQQAEQKVEFFDVSEAHWAKASIDALVAKGVLSGYPDSTFRPANSITRAEFVKMITAAFGIEGSASLPFADTPADAWYAKSLSAAYASGIISGVGDNSFMPDSFITRQDATLIIYRIIKDNLTSEGSLGFDDSDLIASYAREAVAAMSSVGIVNGTGDGKFAPNANIDRQSASVLIYNCIKYM